jgi:uncharacterized protein (DUF2141 family)
MAKKSFKKWLIILAGGVCVLLIVGVVLALNGGIQTGIVRHILLQKDPNAKLESVAFGFSSGEVRGLEMQVAGYPVKLGSASVQYSLTNLLFGGTKTIESATVKDLVFDASQPPKKEAAAASTSAAGGKSAPPLLLIKKADISGSALLPGQRAAQFSLSAQNLGSNSDGTATGNVIFQDKSPGAKVGEMRTDTKINVSLDGALMPKNLDLLADLAANIPGQTQTAKLQAHALIKPVNATNGEFTLTLAATDAGATPIFSANGTYGTAGSVAGEFSANLARAQIEPFAFGITLPDFSLAGHGQFAADAVQRTGSLKATLTSSAGRLEIIMPQLAGLGALQIAANIDAGVAPGKSSAKALAISAKTLALTLAPQGGAAAVTVELLKPTTVEYGEQGLVLPAGSATDLARVTLTQTPAAWLAAFLPKGFGATGGGFNGQLVIGVGDNGAIVANSAQPVSFAGLNVTQDGATILSGGAIQADFMAQYLGKAVSAQVRKFTFTAQEISHKDVTLATLSKNGQVVQAQFAGNVSITPQPGVLPAVAATGNLSVAVDVDDLDQKALGQTLPKLTPAGLLTLNSTFDVNVVSPPGDPKGASLTVNAFQTTLAKGMGTVNQTFAVANALQKISVPLNANAALPGLNGNLAAIEISGIPLSVVQVFLPPTMKLAGNPLAGKLLLAGTGGATPGYVLHTAVPLTMEKFQYTQGVEDKLSGVTITLAPEAVWQAGNLTGNVHAQVLSTAGMLMDATVTASDIQDTLSAVVSLNGDLTAIAAQPLGAAWRAYLPNTKPQYTVSANATYTTKAITLSSAEALIAPNGGAALADVKLGQAVTLAANLATKPDAKGLAKYVWPKISGDVVTLKLGNLPAGVLALALPGFQLAGRDIAADLVVHGAGDGSYTLTANAPVAATGLGVTRIVDKTTSTEWIHDLTFTIKPSASFNELGLTACGAEDLRFTSGNATLVAGNLTMAFASGNMVPQQATVSVQTDLAQVLRQPMLAKFNNLASGKLQVDATLDAAGAVKLNANVTNWTVRGSTTQLTQMTFANGTGKFDAKTNAVSLSLPVKGTSTEGPTDCVVAAEYGPAGNSHKFSLSLTGNNLVLDDLMAVKEGLLPSPPAAAAPATPAKPVTPAKPAPKPATPTPPAETTPAPVVADTVPIWGDLQGTAQINLKSIRFHSFAILNFQASAQVSPTKAEIPSVTGTFGGAPISFSAALAFDTKQKDMPYQMQSNLSFKNFDVGAYFKSRDASATPPVEGNFSITGNVSGGGGTIDDLIDRVQFNLALNSASGTFHLLDLIPNKSVSGVLKGISGVAGVAGAVLSMFTKNNQASATAATATAILDLISNLNAFQYTKLVFEATRGADLTVKLSQFDMQSAQVELLGTGTITYARGKAIPDQPLNATLSLNAKGGVATGLQAIKLLGAALPSGYNQGPQFNVAGSMQHPDYNALDSLLTQWVKNLGL